MVKSLCAGARSMRRGGRRHLVDDHRVEASQAGLVARILGQARTEELFLFAHRRCPSLLRPPTIASPVGWECNDTAAVCPQPPAARQAPATRSRATEAMSPGLAAFARLTSIPPGPRGADGARSRERSPSTATRRAPLARVPSWVRCGNVVGIRFATLRTRCSERRGGGR